MACISMFVTVFKVMGLVSTLVWLSGFVVPSVPSLTSPVIEWPVDFFYSMVSEARIYFMDPLTSKELYLDNCIYLEYTSAEDAIHIQCYEWSRAASKLFSRESRGEDGDGYGSGSHDSPNASSYAGERSNFSTEVPMTQLLVQKLPKIFLGIVGSVFGFVFLGCIGSKLRV